MNDIVIEYNYHFITNASNEAVEMIANYKLVATGAEYSNGFGIELPFTSSQIQTSFLKRDDLDQTSIQAESELEKVVFIIFDNAHHVFNTSGPINTIQNQGIIAPIDFELQVSFSAPIPMTILSNSPFNPFIFIDGDRSREVHLPDYEPTKKADVNLLGSIHDTSSPEALRFYKTQKNLPWAIHIPYSFEYPKEYAAINLAHKKFILWAESSGSNFNDWFLNKSGYRNNNHLYRSISE